MEVILKQNLEVLDRLSEALKDSIDHVKELDLTSLYTFRDFEPIDAFFDRFERIIDNLFQSTFRTLYKLENLEDPASLMQLSKFIVSIQVAPSIDFLLEIKQLRNRLAHEYIGLGIYNTLEVVEEVLNYCDDLFKIINNVKAYSRKYFKN